MQTPTFFTTTLFCPLFTFYMGDSRAIPGLGSKLYLSNALSMLNKNLTRFVQSLFSVQSICTVRKGSACRVRYITNILATKTALNFRGPFSRIRPAKLTSHSACTNLEIYDKLKNLLRCCCSRLSFVLKSIAPSLT